VPACCCRVPWKLAAFYKSLDNSSSDPDWQKVKDAAFKMKGFFEDLVLNKEQKVCLRTSKISQCHLQ
jgi:hypothetical protein